MSAAGDTNEPIAQHPHPKLGPSSISSSSSENDKAPALDHSDQRERRVLELVRKYTSQSAHNHQGSPFSAPEGSELDPKSDNFRARSWAKAFYQLRYGSEDVTARVAGVAFKSLDVWGHGSPTDFQSTVGNKILKLPSLFGRGSQKIEILRDLDGLVLPGELLCVLGPPGYAPSWLYLLRPTDDCVDPAARPS
jgi:ATP-binding cassette subfamily G (WHITE) protein 2 (PDR)